MSQLSDNQLQTLKNRDQAIKYFTSTDEAKYISYKGSAHKQLIGSTTYERETPETYNFTPGEIVRFFIGRSKGKRLIETFSLQTTMNPGTRAGGDGVLKYINGAAIAMIDKIVINQEGKDKLKIYQKQIYNLLKTCNNRDAWDVIKFQTKIDDLIVGNIENNTNGVNAKVEQVFVLELNRFIQLLGMQSFPVFALNNSELEIEIHLVSDFSLLTDVAGDTNPSIKEMIMINEYIDPGKLVINDILNLDDKGFQNTKPKAINLYNLETLPRKHALPVNQTEYSIKVPELYNKNVVFIEIYVMEDSNNGTGRLPFKYEKINSFSLKSGDNELHNSKFDITDTFYRNVQISDYNPPNPKEHLKSNTYIISYTSNLKDEVEHKSRVVNTFLFSNHGSRFFSESDCVLDFKIATSANPRTLYIDLYMFEPMKIFNKSLLKSGLF